jgi:hypothetical protein
MGFGSRNRVALHLPTCQSSDSHQSIKTFSDNGVFIVVTEALISNQSRSYPLLYKYSKQGAKIAIEAANEAFSDLLAGNSDADTEDNFEANFPELFTTLWQTKIIAHSLLHGNQEKTPGKSPEIHGITQPDKAQNKIDNISKHYDTSILCVVIKDDRLISWQIGYIQPIFLNEKQQIHISPPRIDSKTAFPQFLSHPEIKTAFPCTAININDYGLESVIIKLGHELAGKTAIQIHKDVYKQTGIDSPDSLNNPFPVVTPGKEALDINQPDQQQYSHTSALLKIRWAAFALPVILLLFYLLVPDNQQDTFEFDEGQPQEEAQIQASDVNQLSTMNKMPAPEKVNLSPPHNNQESPARTIQAASNPLPLHQPAPQRQSTDQMIVAPAKSPPATIALAQNKTKPETVTKAAPTAKKMNAPEKIDTTSKAEKNTTNPDQEASVRQIIKTSTTFAGYVLQEQKKMAEIKVMLELLNETKSRYYGRQKKLLEQKKRTIQSRMKQLSQQYSQQLKQLCDYYQPFTPELLAKTTPLEKIALMELKQHLAECHNHKHLSVSQVRKMLQDSYQKLALND